MKTALTKFLVILICVCFTQLIAQNENLPVSRHAISYRYTACPDHVSRLGDRVLGYAQARYLSYLTAIPFLYRHFPYSDKLSIDYQALPYEQEAPRYSSVFYIHSLDSFIEFFRLTSDPSTPPTLFIIDYFPTDISEWERDKSRSIFLEIPWADPAFQAYLKQAFIPKIPIPNLCKEGYLNVAVHIRTLSGNDMLDVIPAFPLKFPNLAYHRSQIRKIYQWNKQRPLYVFLFSDTKNPLKLLEHFQQHFAGTNIIFDIQKLDRPDTQHVIEDFFAMQQFNVLIATCSNFSVMASRLKNFDMVFYPNHIDGNFPNCYIDRVHMISKVSSWFPYDLNVILREENIIKTNNDWFFQW